MKPLLAAVLSVAVLLGLPAPASAASPELVVNPSARTDLGGWRAQSESGTVALKRVAGLRGAGATTGVELSRDGGDGRWAYALVGLRTTFVVGRTYRMTAWLRDPGGAGRRYGILLADGWYRNRPTATAEYVTPAGAGWQQVTRTFVATATGTADTAFYLSLPASGSFDVQVTGVSVQPATAYAPVTVRGRAQVVGFGPDAWTARTGYGVWGNVELQTYQPSSARVDERGTLTITTERAADGFTSARLDTLGKVAVAPGSYVEAAITAPVGAGVWPAFWTMGANQPTVGWPACGELDIFEGTGARPTLAQSAVHMALAGKPSVDRQYGWGEAGAASDLGASLDAGSHLFGVYFDSRTVRFYVDRRPTMTLWASDAIASGRTWPFAKPQFLIVNVAVDGTVDSSATTFPRTMTVSPVSIWRGGVPF
ncbi:glycoside hydrolase family 16 protein [Actinoplanes sp. URMC 104]|uniref:glycoside hydrolase family 16 protein n=1 Tax=Actinoplanes sp. URMC 104 TaxID=3423409 RepID=UPI003F1B6EA5